MDFTTRFMDTNSKNKLIINQNDHTLHRILV